MEHPEECQDPDMPFFDARVPSPMSVDKENMYFYPEEMEDDYIDDFSPWGPLYRNPPPEPILPMPPKLRSKSAKKARKENRQVQDNALAMAAKSSKKKQTLTPNMQQQTLDGAIMRGMRLPAHMSMGREILMGTDFPESLQALEAASADWKSFEDWQIIMTTGVLQGLAPNQLGLPPPAPVSCEMVSYVTSTANPKYRLPRDCQLRLKTIRLREEKKSTLDSIAPPKKKKKTKIEENSPIDKPMFPVPKRTISVLQDDNSRTRTVLYKEVCNAFRKQNNGSPILQRDNSTGIRSVSGSATSAAVFQENGISLDEPIEPLVLLRKRLERSAMPKAFLNETAMRWAQTMNLTVDAHGQLATAHVPPRPPSILERTLAGQSISPSTPGALPSPGVPNAARATHSQPFLPMDGNSQRRVGFLSGNAPSPAPPGSPLPSIGTTAMKNFMGNMTVVSGAAAGTQSTGGTVITPATAAAINTQRQSVQFQQLQRMMASKLGDNGQPGQQSHEGGKLSLDPTRIKEFLVSRGIKFSDQQITDLIKAFSNNNNKLPTSLRTNSEASGTAQVVQNVVPVVGTSSAMSVSHPHVSVVSAGKPTGFSGNVIRMSAPGVRNGSIVPQTYVLSQNQNQQQPVPGSAQIVRQPTVVKRNISTPTGVPNVRNTNWSSVPSPGVVSAPVKPGSVSVHQPLILPNVPIIRSQTTPTSQTTVTVTPAQFQQFLNLAPAGQLHYVRGGANQPLSIQRVPPGGSGHGQSVMVLPVASTFQVQQLGQAHAMQQQHVVPVQQHLPVAGQLAPEMKPVVTDGVIKAEPANPQSPPPAPHGYS